MSSLDPIDQPTDDGAYYQRVTFDPYAEQPPEGTVVLEEPVRRRPIWLPLLIVGLLAAGLGWWLHTRANSAAVQEAGTTQTAGAEHTGQPLDVCTYQASDLSLTGDQEDELIEKLKEVLPHTIDYQRDQVVEAAKNVCIAQLCSGGDRLIADVPEIAAQEFHFAGGEQTDTVVNFIAREVSDAAWCTN